MKLRLLYVIDSLAPGGAETSLAAMAPDLIRGGIDLHVLPLAQPLNLAARLEDAGATVHPPPLSAGRLQNVRAVLKTARAITPHLVHTTLFEADVAGRIAARILGIPTSSSIVSESYGPEHFAESSHLKLRAAQAVDAMTARAAHRFHAVSGSVAASLVVGLRVDRSRVDVIPRGRAPESFPFREPGRRAQERALLGFSESTPVILAVGRLEPPKNLGTLIDALPIVRRALPDAVVLLAGRDGRDAGALRRSATTTALDVRFLGQRDDVPHLLAAADVLAHPSLREGSPGALIEALAVGCPIVASDIPAIREVVGEEGDTASRLVDPNDPTSLGQALVTMLNQDVRSSNLVNRGRQRFEEFYSLEAVSMKMIGFFNRASDLGS